MVQTCGAYEQERMTKIVCESNMDDKRAVGMPDTDWLDRVKKVCNGSLLELKDTYLSAWIQIFGDK